MTAHISEAANRHFLQVLQVLVDNGRELGENTIQIRSPSGTPLATLTLYTDLPKRPKDLPRALRPKAKLSKRQRDAAKRAKTRGNKVAV